MSRFADLDSALAPHGLFAMGSTEAQILIGAGPQMWPAFTTSLEYRDGAPDPLDRWSKRILNALATERGWATAYPSDGPPYAPFIAWALATKRFWQSPSGMLVHDVAGLMVSIRGAFLTETAQTQPAAASPCDSCSKQPCATACPVDALSAKHGYNVAACHAYLDTEAGQDCLTKGCKARRACPVSQSFGRDPAQSAFHMRSFHPT